MHDPLFLALRVPAPWLTRSSLVQARGVRWALGRSRRTNPENLGEPTYPWWVVAAYHPVLAGRTFRFAELVNVWHAEPGGRDSGEVCDYPHGLQLLAHLPHLQLQVPVWQKWRRRLLTRCDWCHGRSGRGRDTVNCAAGWERPDARWWQGERGLMHSDCAGVSSAHRQCVCEQPVQPTGSGLCLRCNLPRAWRLPEARRWVLSVQRQVPPGQRPTAEQNRLVERLWRAQRKAEANAAAQSEPV